MKYIVIALFLVLSISMLSQEVFDLSKFKEIENKDSLSIELDIEFEHEYPYKVSKYNVEIDSINMLLNSSMILKVNKKNQFGMYRTTQNKDYTLFIVKQFPDLDIGSKAKHGPTSFDILLFVYNNTLNVFEDTLLLARSSFWANPINSGDDISVSKYKSVLYFGKDKGVESIKVFICNKKNHSSYRIDGIPNKFAETKYVWKDIRFIKE